ncbi:hypothetical protein JDV02_009796 [Purpureocillium takamizusanense]|uniref:Uncharacterized protein n=1 Tax=Purpureocillium takamizusanense TaxID=2060973 RepID=A0A9Q8QSG2_9HYPO|nr:uncharacterized protein JDV02_009796 [Purpureocillium takamizusanense]UNI24016.1 hypothetical protein JDV02_009796 [Purpureocillium takamizusanense]
MAGLSSLLHPSPNKRRRLEAPLDYAGYATLDQNATSDVDEYCESADSHLTAAAGNQSYSSLHLEPWGSATHQGTALNQQQHGSSLVTLDLNPSHQVLQPRYETLDTSSAVTFEPNFAMNAPDGSYFGTFVDPAQATALQTGTISWPETRFRPRDLTLEPQTTCNLVGNTSGQRYQAFAVSEILSPSNRVQQFEDTRSQFDCEHEGMVENANDTQGMEHASGSELVCFGMFVRILGTCQRFASENGPVFPVKLENLEHFVGTDNPNLKGCISSQHTYLTDALLEVPSLKLQVSCTVSVDPPKLSSSGKPRHTPRATTNCSLDIIIYGPRTLYDSIDRFISDCNENLEDDQKLYLQDPIACDLDVPYCNPHRLPPSDSNCTVSTFDLVPKRTGLQKLDDSEPRTELLDLLDSQEDFTESRPPATITTQLKKHQKQALTFMLCREQGWAFDGSRPDIWEGVESGREEWSLAPSRSLRQHAPLTHLKFCQSSDEHPSTRGATSISWGHYCRPHGFRQNTDNDRSHSIRCEPSRAY